ncbi:flagellar motor protein MotB [Aurantimonas sp. Leaf443]|uniref:flagellar motor protein MotB n=1 Tax=Aurantimonas sp. Leaf443 TaxID=1736378 RepID=UPI000A8793EA|nr:flagellar motor protein MotB [Aurantimonas sp. Leaf443]
MSQIDAQPPVQPIIIVRRNKAHEDHHHGGVWKIAFADFMTALMAFFLVMWLVNATDEKTKKQVAQYFNPIQLNSVTPNSPGIDDGQTQLPSGGAAKEGEPVNPGAVEPKPVAGEATGGEEQAIFRDPYAVLAEITAQDASSAKVEGGVPDGTGLPGLNGGEAFRDPFDPTSWQLQPNSTATDPAAKMRPSEFETVATDVVAPPPAPAAPAAAAAPDVPLPEGESVTAKAAALKAEIEKAVPGSGSGIEVTEGDGGLTISLADSLTTGMFEIGSAKPRAETIRMMEKIAAILSEKKGDLVIRGYTDARPYAGQNYDNWRLSTSRAHMAYYMLSRGGLDESRVESIEGYGDRKPRDPADPLAAVNRRIEILLKEPRP